MQRLEPLAEVPLRVGRRQSSGCPPWLKPRRHRSALHSPRRSPLRRSGYELGGQVRLDYEPDGFCRPTSCPRCQQPVYFIRHNAGSVWFSELGWPWEKHGCFNGAQLSGSPEYMRSLPEAPRAVTRDSSHALLGIVTQSDLATTVEGRVYHMLCTDGRSRRLTISSDYSQGMIMGRFGVLNPGGTLALVHPTYRVRVNRVDVAPAAMSFREDVFGPPLPTPSGGRAVDVQPSAELGAIVGLHRMPCTEVTKRVRDYIRANRLLDTKSPKRVNADDKLRAVLGKAITSVYELRSLVDQHLTD